jgi:predicted nucleic acid-binding protein
MKCIDTTYFVDLIRRPSAIRAITKELDEEGVHATTVFNGTLAHKGKYVGADAIIAAIAINKGCEAVVTRNEEHFRWLEEISGLRVEIY